MTEAHKSPTFEDVGALELFTKVLTSSDANSQGRVVIPKVQKVKAHATAHLPPLDQQEIDVYCKDTQGNEHTLRFHAWINNQSRMYLLDGLQDIQALYGLRVGDSLVFGRMPNGELVACGRPRQGSPPPTRAPAPESPFVPLDRSKRRRKAPQKLYDPADFSEQQEYTLRPQPPKTQINNHMQNPLIPYFEPLVDGIFRASPNRATDAAGRVGLEHGIWTASINLAGELYQAFFESHAAAQEAFEAATGFCS